MAIALSSLPLSDYQIELQSNATVLTPAFGGAQQRIIRLGDRFSMKLSVEPLAYSQAAAIIADLNAGLTSKVTYPVPQPFNVGNPGTPKVSTASQSGSTLAVKGLSTNYQFKKGSWLTLVSGGIRYLHQVTATVSASGTTVTVPILPMLRVSPSVDDTVLVTSPEIEGFLSGNKNAWTVNQLQATGLSISIDEAA